MGLSMQEKKALTREVSKRTIGINAVPDKLLVAASTIVNLITVLLKRLIAKPFTTSPEKIRLVRLSLNLFIAYLLRLYCNITLITK